MRRFALAALCCLPPLVAAADTTMPPTCAVAAEAPERDLAIPQHLLRSIASVESAGRPWTVNADGDGRSFPTKQQAIDFVRQEAAAGARFIDVGCFQVDLFYHPDAFADLEQAFDPDANAAYAGRFLSSLHAGGADWSDAVAAYHSGNPALGSDYRARVYAVRDGALPSDLADPRPPRTHFGGAPPIRFGMRVITPGEASWFAPGLPRIQTP